MKPPNMLKNNPRLLFFKSLLYKEKPPFESGYKSGYQPVTPVAFK
jgi:hypothetical protein